MMESLLERLDGWLTTSDRYCVVYNYLAVAVAISPLLLSYCPSFSPWLIGCFIILFYFIFSCSLFSRTKWHGYRHRLANIGGQTQFDFDYYPKFWMSSRTSLQQTLTHLLRRLLNTHISSLFFFCVCTLPNRGIAHDPELSITPRLP